MTTTQDFIDIEDINHDLVMFKDGSVCLVLEVTAINFGLFSEREQEATIYAYAQLLNSLTFSIQILVSSHQKDITDYLTKIDDHLSKTTSPQIRDQIVKYRDFVKSIVKQGNVLDKKFYISIPFGSIELGLVPKSKATLPNKTNIFERAVTNLAPKRDHMIRLLQRIGLRSHQLTSQELLQLYYDVYNRNNTGIKVTLPTPPQP